jgi:predicted nucleic acid-binding protein
VADLLIDTDVFVDHLRGACRLTLGSSDRASYSVVTLCELFAGSRVDEAAVRTLLAPFTVLVVDPAIAERAGRVRRETGTRIADALIAATALQYDLTILTRNVRDFERVPGVRILPPPTPEV